MMFWFFGGNREASGIATSTALAMPINGAISFPKVGLES